MKRLRGANEKICIKITSINRKHLRSMRIVKWKLHKTAKTKQNTDKRTGTRLVEWKSPILIIDNNGIDCNFSLNSYRQKKIAGKERRTERLKHENGSCDGYMFDGEEKGEQCGSRGKKKTHTHTETLRKLIHSMIILFHSHLDGKHFNTGRLDQCLWIAGNRSKSDEKRIDAFQSYANANDNAVDYLTI